VANGDFNEPLNVGWHKRAVNYSGDYRIERIKEGEEYYARIYKDACGYAQLEQKVMLTRLSSLLSFRAKFFANSNNEEYASAGAVVIEYLNREMRKLGATYFCSRTPNFTDWQNSATLHLYEVPNGIWREFSLNIGEELKNYLPGIPKEEVKFIKIILLAYCTQESGC